MSVVFGRSEFFSQYAALKAMSWAECATTEKRTEWLEAARTALSVESEAINSASQRLDQELIRAVETIINATGKVIVTGVGKSGHIGQTIAATLCATGTRAVFLHPTEAMHGDLGLYSPGDVSIVISNSGATAELVRLVPVLRGFGSPIIGILGNRYSPLAPLVDHYLDASVAKEADPENIVPTASAVTALAVGHALVVGLMAARGFSREQWRRVHPA